MNQSVRKEFEFTSRDFLYLRDLASRKTGIVINDDKFDMLYSRLSRRLRALQLNSFSAYCDYIDSHGNEGEFTELINAITTNITSFFREKHHFDYLRNVAVPERLKRNDDPAEIAIWSAGCSTGEEPYSLAMTLDEIADQLRGWKTTITATDIDSHVIATALRGVYTMNHIESLTQKQLKRWFMKGKGQQQGKVRVNPDLRKNIEFKLLNLMDAWEKKPQDIIFCRNVIIYFEKEAKKRLVERFAATLKPGGYLFIGHSESLYKVTDSLKMIGKTIYRRVD